MTTDTLRIGILGIMCLFSLFSCQSRGEEVNRDIEQTTLVVSVRDQKMALIREGRPLVMYPVSTSRFGTGDKPGSYATPLGQLVVRKKIGRGCRLGTVFKTRVPTGEVLPPNAPGRDPIVTRILWLDGQEGRNRNAFARCIYIHGTPQENLLGKPVSYGCIRMRSKDVVALADSLSTGTHVTITADHLPNTCPSRHRLLACVF
jgi:lipoprotein-anchoring transpeptidase ErfK/SrfK